MRDKGLATAVATLLAAFATAHLMQFGLSAGRAISGDVSAAPIGLATLVAQRGDALPAEHASMPSMPDAVSGGPVLRIPAGRALPRDEAVSEALGDRGENGFGIRCERTLTLEPAPGAMLRARLRAPCDAGMRVEFRHAGLRFALETGADGRIDADLPAMSADAVVEAAFADGTVRMARLLYPDAAGIDRVAVVAEGWAGLSLHAHEQGAWKGGTGHVFHGAANLRPGALHRLGDPGVEAPLLAEVYTFVAGRFGAFGDVRVIVEARVSPANCARDITAEVLRSDGSGPPERAEMRLAMPTCEAAGDVLVVGLPSPDVRLARN